ncbi:MAG: TetR/AcrR family transcriptional regulator [Microvirga sp.]
MSRTIGSSGPKTVAAIRKAGLHLIYKHGYEAMSLRQLAAEVGIQQGSLYNHIRTKQDLLFDLIMVHMDDLFREFDDSVPAAGPAIDRLKAFVRFHVGYHVNRKEEVFICYSELRSLEAENFRTVCGLRQDYERKLTHILEDGVAEGAFAPSDMKVAAYGILSMLSGICTWFHPEGRLSKDQICALFTTMVLNAVARPARKADLTGKAASPVSGSKPRLARAGARP